MPGSGDGTTRRRLVAAAGVALAGAVGLGGAASGNKALEAGLDRQQGAAVYLVEVAEEGEVSVHRVDPVSGVVRGED
jgi:hypothetical protein